MGTKLTTGERYNVDQLVRECFIGWSDYTGDPENTVSVFNWFDNEGKYLGPDLYGLEPLFNIPATKEGNSLSMGEKSIYPPLIGGNASFLKTHRG